MFYGYNPGADQQRAMNVKRQLCGNFLYFKRTWTTKKSHKIINYVKGSIFSPMTRNKTKMSTHIRTTQHSMQGGSLCIHDSKMNMRCLDLKHRLSLFAKDLSLYRGNFKYSNKIEILLKHKKEFKNSKFSKVVIYNVNIK
jgi:hypothetical protein